MNRPAHFALQLALVLSFPTLVQAQKGQSTPLERARSTFAVADADADGKLDAQEISKASIRATAARQWDADQDGALSKDEFLVYYRKLVLDAGRAPGEGLERQVDRILKARKQPTDRDAGQRTGAQGKRPGAAPVSSGGTTADKYRRAREALQERLKKAGSRPQAGPKPPAGPGARARSQAGPTAKVPASDPGAAVQPGSSIRRRLGEAQRDQGRPKGGVSLPRTLERADQNIVQQGLEKNARRARVSAAQDQVAERARSAADESLEPTAEERAKLQRSFEILEARARSAGWTPEQLAGQKRKLVERLRGQGQPEARAPRTDSTRRRAEATEDSQRVNGARGGAQPREREKDREESRPKSDAPAGGAEDTKPKGSETSRGNGGPGQVS